MADGFSRVSNGKKFGVFTMQQGPGAENAFGGVAQAFADSVPVLHLPGGEALSRQGIHPTFEAVRNYRHITKWAAQIYAVEEYSGHDASRGCADEERAFGACVVGDAGRGYGCRISR